MPKGCPLASKEAIRLSDLKGQPVIVSIAAEPYFAGSAELSSLNVVATYNLIYNASLLVEDGLGYAICFENLINTTGDSPLCMRPIVLQMKVTGYLIWKIIRSFLLRYRCLSIVFVIYSDSSNKVLCSSKERCPWFFMSVLPFIS